ncbi:hypothetical protein V9L05_02630 [Bernardetia sp. Wsw4-3y2]|uniref:hypothetical protein n=1 Tax=Bernardetia sp. Wsw4-3y2 TaxID=3127471 RepID=UPI0030CBD72A
MRSHYNEIRNKVIELGFTVTKIENRKFKIMRDKEKYTLKLIPSKHLNLILTSEDDGISITIDSMNELVILLYQTNKSQIPFE